MNINDFNEVGKILINGEVISYDGSMSLLEALKQALKTRNITTVDVILNGREIVNKNELPLDLAHDDVLELRTYAKPGR